MLLVKTTSYRRNCWNTIYPLGTTLGTWVDNFLTQNFSIFITYLFPFFFSDKEKKEKLTMKTLLIICILALIHLCLANPINNPVPKKVPNKSKNTAITSNDVTKCLGNHDDCTSCCDNLIFVVCMSNGQGITAFLMCNKKRMQCWDTCKSQGT